MPSIVISGAVGFLGWHLRAHLESEADVDVIALDRSAFADGDHLKKAVAEADAMLHLAGLNRGEDNEIESVNVALTEQLIAACEDQSATPHVVFVSSTHRDLDTAYGRSKRRSAELLAGWAASVGAEFTEAILPNVFGECGKPYYNSVVATFCHQIANGETPRIIEDRELELIHAQDAAGHLWSMIRDSATGQHRVEGDLRKVSSVLDCLSRLHEQYCFQGIVPETAAGIERQLFKTLRSHLHPGHFPVVLEMHSDDRGQLFETVKSRSGGQSFVSTTHPGVTRGGHYHRDKFERFLILEGRAIVRIRRLFSEKIDTFELDGEVPAYVDIPTLHTHDVTAVGPDPLLMLFWADEIFDPENSDTFEHRVDPVEGSLAVGSRRLVGKVTV